MLHKNLDKIFPNLQYTLTLIGKNLDDITYWEKDDEYLAEFLVEKIPGIQSTEQWQILEIESGEDKESLLRYANAVCKILDDFTEGEFMKFDFTYQYRKELPNLGLTFLYVGLTDDISIEHNLEDKLGHPTAMQWRVSGFEDSYINDREND